jgi:DNA-binding MurR/RpiR family transcriptional regulator
MQSVVTISETQRHQVEGRIRAASDRLLSGTIPPGGSCDIKTLAREAGISRAALYRTYSHLKAEAEFEERLARMRAEGHLPDPRVAQILRLRDENAVLRQRLAKQNGEIDELTTFKTAAISRLAAQHDEIERLRVALAAHSNVSTLTSTRSSSR